jgi:hypothetical protein
MKLNIQQESHATHSKESMLDMTSSPKGLVPQRFCLAKMRMKLNYIVSVADFHAHQPQPRSPDCLNGAVVTEEI